METWREGRIGWWIYTNPKGYRKSTQDYWGWSCLKTSAFNVTLLCDRNWEELLNCSRSSSKLTLGKKTSLYFKDEHPGIDCTPYSLYHLGMQKIQKFARSELTQKTLFPIPVLHITERSMQLLNFIQAVSDRSSPDVLIIWLHHCFM